MEYVWGTTAKVSLPSNLSHADFAPLLDDLNKVFAQVETSRWDIGPTAAGGPPVAIVIDLYEIAIGAGALGAGAILKSFLEELGKDLYQHSKIRKGITELMKQARTGERGYGGYLPLEIRSGEIRFIFHEEVSAEEFEQRLQEALKVLRDQDEEALKTVSDPNVPAPGHYWSGEDQSWIKRSGPPKDWLPISDE